MELITHKIEHGPEVLVLHDPAAFTASFGWFVKTGARDEQPSVAGVSHFLEHMVFKGTERRTPEDVNRELDHLGAQSNAFTSEDSTVFYASVLPECQLQAVDLLTDLMQPRFFEEDFDMEKQVILEEIAMYDDQPPYGAFERVTELFFGQHPLSTRVLGTAETVSDLTVAQMRSYHRHRYAKDNMYFAASGKVDVSQLVDQLSELVVDWPETAKPTPRPTPKFHSAEECLERELAHQSYLVCLWPGLNCNHPDRYALRLLCSILADDSGSRLFWELIDTGRAETATLWPQMFDDCGCITGYLCCAPEDTAENEAVLERTIRDVVEHGVTAKELELARSKIGSSLILSDERPGNRLFALGQSWLNRRSYEPLEVILRKYHDVTTDDVQRVAAETLLGETASVRIVGNAELD
ncbi:MAG: insulinase family protein [bacterium]|nr:insulinase family protein [bacterium]